MTEPFKWSVAEAAQHIAARRVSSREVIQALQARIAQHDASLQAWALLAGRTAGAEAAACDEDTARGISRGVLHGVPIAIKDNLDVAGMPTRAGSDLTDDLPAVRDAAAVLRLRAAGAIVLGKTAMTAFAAMDPAPTRNPWNGANTPGGSSSGSAAAVAAQMCGGALGTQTAGSVLRPAAYCGVVGLKPSYGATSREGLLPCAWSMDHVGVIARDVADIELMFGVLASQAPRTGDGDTALVVGIPDRGFDIADAGAALAFDRAMDVLADAGASFISIDLPDGFEALSAAGIVTMYAEMAAFHRELFSRRSAQYPPRLRVLVEAGLKLSASDYLNAQRVRRIETVRLASLLDGVTVLLTPTTATPAPLGQASTGDWRFNLPFSTSGHPAITLPCGLSPGGLPVGLQAVAAHGREDRLFAFGRLFQQHSDWHARRAPLTTTGNH
jgi:aspartyl-tRNA(Asn)/glutamyl-tRNA(Gln) amidotransferase subunit A